MQFDKLLCDKLEVFQIFYENEKFPGKNIR